MAPRPTLEFLKTEAGGGAALVASAALALALANSPFASDYFDLIGAPFTVRFGPYVETLSVRDWVGQGLMSVFFFVVGLEIKQELLKGELSSFRRLVLPIAAAVGGMMAPAFVYLGVNLAAPGGVPAAWPVPTATDIAFALAALALVSRGLPDSLRLFLLTVAIADDLGAIALIAVLYTGQLHLWALACMAATLLALIGLSEWRDAPFLFRATGFVLLAAFTLKSGVSTSLAGVAAAFTVPIGPRRPGQEGVLKHFMQSLHPYVAYGVLPLFAFTAAGISFSDLRLADALAPAPIGVAAGLFFGKQAGVLAAVFAAVRSGLARRPTGAGWLELYGVALLCGVGFTLSLFLGALAFAGGGELARSRMTLGVLAGSLASALAGMAVLALAARLRARPAIA
ncbi:MAG TPA: Na+/H+ antiporter NhaA [Caulobacteraceae bacterium]|nr:Na+/H+ antiporter NhaA [Caulobacteraceae bacterium]